MYGAGEYILTNIREVEVSKGLQNIFEEKEVCQNKETVKECQTRIYQKLGQERCNCTPYELRNYEEMVNINSEVTTQFCDKIQHF